VAIGVTVIWPNAAHAESRTTNRIDGTSVEFGGPYTLGDSGPFNFLIVTNGGALTNTIGTIGSAESATNNVALVGGTNSVWKNNGDLIVGNSGSGNSLHIAAGGRVLSASGLLGLA
jgi:T5SS/PEP-CTERM-associated repeat protein